MPAPNQSTFDGNPRASPPLTQGYRPGAEDFNGAALADLAAYPPNPATMPTAALFNTYGLLLASLGRMVPTAVISVNAGASPTVAFVGTAANNVVGNPFAVIRTAAGNYNITYPAGTLPTPIAQAEASLNVVLGAHNYSVGCVNITNGVQVTTTQDGVLTDLAFTVRFW